MPITREMRVLTLLVECEKETGPIGSLAAGRIYKMEGLNNVVVLSESALTDVIDTQAVADAFERLVIHQSPKV